MRIIRAAKQVREVEITCIYCKSILGVEREDVHYNSGDYSITCPVCNQYMNVASPASMFPWIIENKEDETQWLVSTK